MLKRLSFGLMLVGALVAQPGNSSFTGSITDSECANGDHSHMRMGPNDAECTKACIVFHDAQYVLWDGKQAYTLRDQTTPEKFAGQRVKVTGTLDAKTKTIKVASLTAAP